MPHSSIFFTELRRPGYPDKSLSFDNLLIKFPTFDTQIYIQYWQKAGDLQQMLAQQQTV